MYCSLECLELADSAPQAPLPSYEDAEIQRAPSYEDAEIQQAIAESFRLSWKVTTGNQDSEGSTATPSDDGIAAANGTVTDASEPVQPPPGHRYMCQSDEDAAKGRTQLDPELLAMVEEDRAQFIEEYKNLRALLVEPDATAQQIEEQRFAVFSGISALNELLRTAGMKSWGGGVNSLLSEVRTTVDDDRFDENFHAIASDVASPLWQDQLREIAQAEDCLADR